MTFSEPRWTGYDAPSVDVLCTIQCKHRRYKSYYERNLPDRPTDQTKSCGLDL